MRCANANTYVRYGPCECDMRMRICAMDRTNTLCDTRIRYGPREYDMRYANTLRAARMRYAIGECAKGRANAHAICEYATRYEQLQSGFLSHHSLGKCVVLIHAAGSPMSYKTPKYPGTTFEHPDLSGLPVPLVDGCFTAILKLLKSTMEPL